MIRLGLLRRSPGSGVPRFAHPLLRGAVVDGWPRSHRHALQLRAAELRRHRGGGSKPWRGTCCEPPRRYGASRRGTPGRGVRRVPGRQDRRRRRYLRRALDEPMPRERRAAVLTELGELEFATLRTGGIPRLAEALRLQERPRDRVLAAVNLGNALADRGKRTPRSTSCAIWARWTGTRPRPHRPRRPRSSSTTTRRSGGRSTPGCASAPSAPRMGQPGPPCPADPLRGHGRAGVRRVGHAADPAAADGPGGSAPGALPAGCGRRGGAVGRRPGGRRTRHPDRVDRALAVATAPRPPVAAQRAGGHRCRTRPFPVGAGGDRRQAGGHRRLAPHGCEQLPGPPRHRTRRVRPFRRGRTARRRCQRRRGGAGQLGAESFLYARGVLRASVGDPAGALDDFRECGRRQTGRDVQSPVVTPWRSAAAECHLLLGETPEALALAEEESRYAAVWDTPRVRGRALRVLGTATGGRRGLALTAEAVGLLRGTSLDIELVPALIAHGVQLTAAGQPRSARPLLREAGRRPNGWVLSGCPAARKRPCAPAAPAAGRPPSRAAAH